MQQLLGLNLHSSLPSSWEQPWTYRNVPGKLRDPADSTSSSAGGFVAHVSQNTLQRLIKLTLKESHLPQWKRLFAFVAYLEESDLEDSVSYAGMTVSLEKSMCLSLG